MTIWSILIPIYLVLFGSPEPSRPAPVGYPTSMPATVFTAPIGHLEGER